MMNRFIICALSLLIMSVGSIGVYAQDTKFLPFASEITSDIKHFNRAAPNLATSGTPSLEAFKELAEKGIETFIDLRTETEMTEKARMVVEAAGAQYYNIPIFGAEGISKHQVNEFAKIYDQSKGMVLVNCGSGNRVGALWTAYQMSNGLPHDIAIKEGRTVGMRAALEQDVKTKFCSTC